jgi:hypothetical protein
MDVRMEQIYQIGHHHFMRALYEVLFEMQHRIQ